MESWLQRSARGTLTRFDRYDICFPDGEMENSTADTMFAPLVLIMSAEIFT